MSSTAIKKLQKGSLVALICCVFFACNKKPSAEFTIDKTSCSAGDIINVTDKSKNAHKYLWALRDPGGLIFSEIEKATSTLTMSMLAGDGNYTIELTTYSKKGDESASASKFILVKTIRGVLRIASASNFSAQADNQAIGSSENGSLVVNLPVGIHYISLSTGQAKTITITENSNITWIVQ